MTPEDVFSEDVPDEDSNIFTEYQRRIDYAATYGPGEFIERNFQAFALPGGIYFMTDFYGNKRLKFEEDLREIIQVMFPEKKRDKVQSSPIHYKEANT